MSKANKEQHEAGSSEAMIDQTGQPALPEIPITPGPQDAGVVPDQPEIPPPEPPPPEPGSGEAADKQEPFMPVKMTVGQYLKRNPQSAGISDLIRSLYSTKVMSFEEWRSTVNTLLKKQVK
jgi:hypothetical protein